MSVIWEGSPLHQYLQGLGYDVPVEQAPRDRDEAKKHAASLAAQRAQQVASLNTVQRHGSSPSQDQVAAGFVLASLLTRSLLMHDEDARQIVSLDKRLIRQNPTLIAELTSGFWTPSNTSFALLAGFGVATAVTNGVKMVVKDASSSMGMHLFSGHGFMATLASCCTVSVLVKYPMRWRRYRSLARFRRAHQCISACVAALAQHAKMVKACITRVQETEAVSRGYAVTAPMVPVSRMEASDSTIDARSKRSSMHLRHLLHVVMLRMLVSIRRLMVHVQEKVPLCPELDLDTLVEFPLHSLGIVGEDATLEQLLKQTSHLSLNYLKDLHGCLEQHISELLRHLSLALSPSFAMCTVFDALDVFTSDAFVQLGKLAEHHVAALSSMSAAHDAKHTRDLSAHEQVLLESRYSHATEALKTLARLDSSHMDTYLRHAQMRDHTTNQLRTLNATVELIQQQLVRVLLSTSQHAQQDAQQHLVATQQGSAASISTVQNAAASSLPSIRQVVDVSKLPFGARYNGDRHGRESGQPGACTHDGQAGEGHCALCTVEHVEVLLQRVRDGQEHAQNLMQQFDLWAECLETGLVALFDDSLRERFHGGDGSADVDGNALDREAFLRLRNAVSRIDGRDDGDDDSEQQPLDLQAPIESFEADAVVTDATPRDSLSPEEQLERFRREKEQRRLEREAERARQLEAEQRRIISASMLSELQQVIHQMPARPVVVREQPPDQSQQPPQAKP
eukprot:m.62262 g.62262  ORF g.62262 m.62262 type:complete len:736 (+) comp11903_c0_seq2:116-2323(+)